MDQGKFFAMVKEYKLVALLFGVSAIFLLFGLFSLLGSATTKGEPITFQSAASESAQLNGITIDVAGAVATPGVYTLASDARVTDALKAAGGMGTEADSAWIAKHINLAAKLQDGMKLYVPAVGESTTNELGVPSGGGVSLNSGSASELESLPGIGKVTAGKIIAARPFVTIEDLLKKKIVGQKVFEQIKDKVALH